MVSSFHATSQCVINSYVIRNKIGRLGFPFFALISPKIVKLRVVKSIIGCRENNNIRTEVVLNPSEALRGNPNNYYLSISKFIFAKYLLCLWYAVQIYLWQTTKDISLYNMFVHYLMCVLLPGTTRFQTLSDTQTHRHTFRHIV